MKYILFFIGTILLLYWGAAMSTTYSNRPRLINESGGAVFFVAIALIFLGFVF